MHGLQAKAFVVFGAETSSKYAVDVRSSRG